MQILETVYIFHEITAGQQLHYLLVISLNIIIIS